MSIPRPTDEDRAFFASVVPDDPRVEVKPLFGNLGAFVNGNMFMGLFGSSVGLRLPEEALVELLAEDGAGPFGPQQRPMGGYAAVPPAWRSTPERVRPWVQRALQAAAALPPKKARGTR